MLTGCGGDALKEYNGTTPVMTFEEFFNGPMLAQGFVQNRSGKVIRRFDIEMNGTWTGDTGTLDERFTYYDGETMHRAWNIRKVGQNKYIGTASDIVGEATGESRGSAIRWKYVMQVPVDGTTYNITFDDWMFRMNGDTVMNRSYMSKFGFSVGEVTVVMRKL